MATTTSTKTTEATLPKRNPKTGRFEKSATKDAKPVMTAKPVTTPAKKG